MGQPGKTTTTYEPYGSTGPKYTTEKEGNYTKVKDGAGRLIHHSQNDSAQEYLKDHNIVKK
jgi:hypothetical protein